MPRLAGIPWKLHIRKKCVKVHPFLQGIDRKEGNRSPYRARIGTFEIPFPEECEKKRVNCRLPTEIRYLRCCRWYCRYHQWQYRQDPPSRWEAHHGECTSHRPGLRSPNRAGQERTASPRPGTGPELPGRYPGQGHAVKARDLALVFGEGLKGIRERGLRTLHFHEHDPEVFDDDEIEGPAPSPATFSTLPRRFAISTASSSARTGRRAPGHHPPPFSCRSSSRSSSR